VSTNLPTATVAPNPSVTGSQTEGQSANDEGASGAIRLLRLLLVGTIVLPLLLGAIGGYFSYRAQFARAEDALVGAVAVAEENTIKVLDTHQLVAARIDDLLASLTDADIRTQEKSLHERLAQQIKDLPQVAAAWAIDANGRELVSARVYPVNRDLNHSQRDDFRALQNPELLTFIWGLRARSLGQNQYQPFFSLARRRQTTNGRFRGIAVVAVSGAYFASFFNSLALNGGEYAAGVFREDGANLARYPDDASDGPISWRDDLLVTAIADRPPSGVVNAGSPIDREGRLVAYKRVAGYPFYVTVGRSQASILHEWLQAAKGYVAIGAVATLSLTLLCLVALRRIRREQTALAQARDAIAQRAEVENQLHQAQKMEGVGQLTAGIAHDFNNQITVIKGNIKMLELNLDDSDSRFQKFISSAMQGCERATTLAGRLLSFSRRGPSDARPVDVNNLIAGMSDLLRRSLGTHIGSNIRLADSVWRVFVDPNQLENALLNLTLNARDAMAEGGHLTIEVANSAFDEVDANCRQEEPTGPCVRISITDSGCGMSKEVREKAFEPFFTTKEAEKGSGLGLSQVCGFINRSGGHCAIESEIGRGTTVNLYLPRYIDEAVETHPEVRALEAVDR
jgi:signal transduction histidine kinase